MSWEIAYTAKARQDLRDIFEYIAYTLCEPDIAKKQVRKIIEKIDKLEMMPLQFPLYVNEPWRSQGLRFFPVDHYLIFYLPIENINTVEIVRVMYSGRDVKGQFGVQTKV